MIDPIAAKEVVHSTAPAWITAVVAVISLGVSAFTGWVAMKIKNSTLSNKLDLAEFENNLIERLNGTYVRSKEFSDFKEVDDRRHKDLVEHFEAQNTVVSKAIQALTENVEKVNSHQQYIYEQFIECRAIHRATQGLIGKLKDGEGSGHKNSH